MENKSLNLGTYISPEFKASAYRETGSLFWG